MLIRNELKQQRRIFLKILKILKIRRMYFKMLIRNYITLKSITKIIKWPIHSRRSDGLGIHLEYPSQRAEREWMIEWSEKRQLEPKLRLDTWWGLLMTKGMSSDRLMLFLIEFQIVKCWLKLFDEVRLILKNAMIVIWRVPPMCLPGGLIKGHFQNCLNITTMYIGADIRRQSCFIFMAHYK